MIDPHVVAAHYNAGDILKVILASLGTMGKDITHLTLDDLAPVDAFHIRGREATVELADRIQLSADEKVLDVGCGLGGSARYLASRYSCHVTGIDLTLEFIDVANALSERVGMSESTVFRQASALEMPVEECSFDVAWTEHVQMNIADKAGFYGEIARVLKPGGRFIFHDIFQGEGGEIHFPVPWAEESSISHLATPTEIRNTLENAGLQIVEWEEKTPHSLAWFRSNIEKTKSTGPPPLGIHLLMGDNARIKLANMVGNLNENRINVIQSVVKKR